MSNFKVLKTDTFILRELKDSDEKDLYKICNQIHIQKYIPGFYMKTLRDVNHIFILANSNKNILFLIQDYDEKVIGLIFAYINLNSDFANISYLIDENERGKGIIPEAIKVFIEYLYSYKLVFNINFYININNHASIRVMRKLNIPFILNEEECLNFYLSLSKEPSF